MTAETIALPPTSSPEPVPPTRPVLVLVGRMDPEVEAQQEFLSQTDRLLRRAGASGDRMVTALYLILAVHAAIADVGSDRARYICAVCRPDAHPAQSYPCPTAEQATWALEAVFR